MELARREYDRQEHYLRGRSLHERLPREKELREKELREEELRAREESSTARCSRENQPVSLRNSMITPRLPENTGKSHVGRMMENSRKMETDRMI